MAPPPRNLIQGKGEADQEREDRIVAAGKEERRSQHADERPDEHSCLTSQDISAKAVVRALADLLQLQNGDDQERHPEEVAQCAQLGEAEDKGVVRGQAVVLGEVLKSDPQNRTGAKHVEPLRPGVKTL